MPDNIVRAFMSLFRGRKDAWGSVEGRSNKETVTRKHYEQHLKGETSLGAYMLQDDGTCWFFAIDLDEKDIDKALAIRGGFNSIGIPVYLAFSKGKGFHCFGFAGKEPFNAGKVRQLCHAVLSKVAIAAEVFPKQSQLDKLIPLGNYINLPCFGNTRQFFGVSKTHIPLEKVITKIVRITNAQIEAALKAVPPLPRPKIVRVKGRPKKSHHPPCIETILKGVGSGSRDVAAFALARHYLDQNFLPEEVLGLLQTWDNNNKPPLNDPHLLDTKVRSAAKGYQFGCSSIIEQPQLAGHCVGEEICPWLKAVTADKKKRGLLREQSFHETETHLYEEIVQDGKPMFVMFEKSTGNISYVSKIDCPEFSIVPIWTAEITEGAITLPTGVEECGSTVELKNEVRDLIYSYVDMKTIDLEFSAWYILLAWVFDRLNTISYLRFLGDTGCGKSRGLDVIGRLCYKPLMMAGAATPAPMYRLIRRWRGTLIMEEADFRDTSEKSEIITILNCGFERNRPVIRCSQDDPNNIEILPCYGPKVFATRRRFEDVALEARCMTFKMEETDREDIPALLGTTFEKRARQLRNKLLMWRLRHRSRIDPDIVEEIDLGNLEPRLKQIGLPFAIPFKDYPEVMDEFRRFMQIRQAELIQQRSDTATGKIVHALLKMALAHGKDQITPSLISQCLANEFKIEKTSAAVGKVLANTLNVARSNRRSPSAGRARFLEWEDRLMRKLRRRYITDPEDFKELFEEKEEKPNELSPDLNI